MKRRKFLQSIPMAVLPAMFGSYGIKAFGANSMLGALAADFTETDHVLVLVQLNGGNDGLNTVIPLDQYSALSAARANILIPENKVLKLNGVTATGFHPAMTGMKTLFDEGKLKVIQGVSYPNPNFSHFRATDIWLTGANSNQNLTSGWAGRYLAEEYPNYPVGFPNTTMPDPLAVQIGSVLSQGLQGLGGYNMSLAVSDITNFYTMIDGTTDPAPNSFAGKELTYIREVAKQTKQYTQVIQSAATAGSNSATYPTGNRLADQLKIVAKLISGGLKTRIYMVNIGGFDTHSNQIDQLDVTQGTHANLWAQVSDAIKVFQDDLAALQLQDRVTGMTFSEFGRRIKSNSSAGTDHGQAAPMFVFGAKVQGGFLGVNPTIPANADVNSNVPMQYDFRSVYASLLKDWFCVPQADLDTIMLQNFQTLPIVNADCSITANSELNKKAGEIILSASPNPFTEQTTINFDSHGGHTLVHVFNEEGREIKTLINSDLQAGSYSVDCNLGFLPAGTYYCRIQNGMLQQVKAIIKVR